MTVVYSARYQIDIEPHVFPTRTCVRVHRRLLDAGVIQPSDCIEPEPASWDDLAGGYARRVQDTVAIHAATIEEAPYPGRRELQLSL